MYNSKGWKLEQKNKLEAAAQWYEKHGEYDHAARCWSAFGQHSRSAECLERIRHFREAADCYARAQMPDRAGACFEKGEMWGHAGGQWIALGLWERAGVCYSKLGGELWLHLCRAVPEHAFGSVLEQVWETLLSLISQGEPVVDIFYAFSDVGYTYGQNFSEDMTRKRGQARRIISAVKENPSRLTEIVDAFLSGLGAFSDHPVQSPIRFAAFLRNECGLPASSCHFCRAALERRLKAHSKCQAWYESERLWITEILDSFGASRSGADVVEYLISRHRYGDAAEILEQMGKPEEALVLLEKAGPANFSSARMPIDWDSIDPPVRKGHWEERIQQLKGRMAISRPPTPIGMTGEVLEQMLALGEITVEEFERLREPRESDKRGS